MIGDYSCMMEVAPAEEESDHRPTEKQGMMMRDDIVVAVEVDHNDDTEDRRCCHLQQH